LQRRQGGRYVELYLSGAVSFAGSVLSSHNQILPTADYVIKTIKDRLLSRDFKPDTSVALIYRTNAQSRALEEACVKENLPYVIFGSATSFYKRQEVKDCLCFLRWLKNGRDRSAMLRAIVTPKRGIGETAIREFEEYCEYVDSQWEAATPGPNPFDVLMSLSGPTDFDDKIEFDPAGYLSTRPRKLFKEFSSQMRQIRDIAWIQPLEQVLSLIVSEFELLPHLDKISKSKAEFEERKANVEELRQAAGRYTKSGPCLVVAVGGDDDDFKQSPLGAFLDDVALVADMSDNTENSKENRFVVNLMTIHASKGMEFDVVFVVGNEDGTLPTSQVSLGICRVE
jgi:DNA helicase-2/ATP-dependent DNA helicase PcrA